MAEKPETLTNLNEQFPSWRAQHSDLPVVLSILSLLKDHFSSHSVKSQENNSWQDLRRRGTQLARRQALFIAAEAAGHLPAPQKGTESQTIIDDLGLVINEGNSLHKVRALRAMRFVASEECIPFLEQGLQDSSPWVQATALQTLFRLNLREKKPRRVFQAFLLATFRDSLTSKSLFSRSDYKRNFFLNKGLFVGLVKERGGLPLASVSLLLWLITLILKTVIPVISLLSIVVAVIAVLIYVIVAMPLWIRRVFQPRNTPSLRDIFLSLLDYGFVLLFLWETWVVRQTDFTPVMVSFWFLHCASGLGNKYTEHFGEDLRALNRFLLGMGAAYVAFRFGESRQILLVIAGVSAVQLIWAWAGIIRVIVNARTELKKRISRFAAQLDMVQEVVGSKFLELLLKVMAGIFGLPRSILLTTTFLILTILALFVASKLGYQLEPQFIGRLRLRFSGIPRIFDPYFFAFLGLMAVLLYSFAGSLILRVLWDELLVVERIRFQTLASRPSHFGSVTEFIAYAIRAIKNSSNPLGIRLRAVLALSQVPLANTNSINQLLDVAEADDLHPKVRDALFQVVDAAEKRLQRGQNSTLNIDMDLVNKQIEPLWSPGSLLRTNLRLGLLTLVLISIGLSILTWFNSQLAFTDITALLELSLGICFLLYYVFTLGQVSDSRKLLLVLGLGLLGVSLTHPLQLILVTSDWWQPFPVISLEFVDGKTLLALIIPTLLFVVCAQAGQTIYLLDSDIRDPKVSAPSTERRQLTGFAYHVNRRIHRLGLQKHVPLRIILIALFITAVQSVPLQELINLKGESMPVFAADAADPLRRLDNIPMDGRLIRVALVDSPKAENSGSLELTFPFASNVLRDPKTGLRPIDIYLSDPMCGGEVWMASEEGRLQTWQTLPGGCLDLPVVRDNSAIFDIRAGCSFKTSVRLVAIVYDQTRSGAIKKRTVAGNALIEVNTASPSKPRIFADTLSPFARAVWSDVLPASVTKNQP